MRGVHLFKGRPGVPVLREAVVLLAVLLLVTVSVAAPQDDLSVQAAKPNVPPAKPVLTDAEKKLSTRLLELTNSSYLPPGKTRQQVICGLQVEKAYISRWNGRQRSRWGRSVGGRARLRDGRRGKPLAVVDAHAWRVQNRHEPSRTVEAWVPVARLNGLAAIPGVTIIDVVTAPEVQTGSVAAQADAILLAQQVRARSGLSGYGVKVGVISDGVNHRADAIASGDLPSSLTVLSDRYPDSDEGTAMLGIVHDIAPGAQLFFHDCGSGSLDFMNSINALYTAGCDVIVDDVGWISDPFYEDGPLAQHVESLARSGNFLYVSSAGTRRQALPGELPCLVRRGAVARLL